MATSKIQFTPERARIRFRPEGPAPFTTELSPEEENQFQGWAKTNGVRMEPGWNEDYDMRGLWKSDPNITADPRGHWPDTFKKPNHPTFSAESIYATQDAPRWVGSKLIDKSGKVIADETPPAEQAPAPAPVPAPSAARAAEPVGPEVPIDFKPQEDFNGWRIDYDHPEAPPSREPLKLPPGLERPYEPVNFKELVGDFSGSTSRVMPPIMAMNPEIAEAFRSYRRSELSQPVTRRWIEQDRFGPQFREVTQPFAAPIEGPPGMLEPTIHLPRFGQQEGKVSQVGAGAANAVIGGVEALSAPASLLPVATGPKVAGSIFGAITLEGAARSVPEVIKGIQAGDWQHTAEAATSGGLMAYFAKKSMNHLEGVRQAERLEEIFNRAKEDARRRALAASRGKIDTAGTSEMSALERELRKIEYSQMDTAGGDPNQRPREREDWRVEFPTDQNSVSVEKMVTPPEPKPLPVIDTEQSALKDYPAQQVPAGEIAVDPELMQFKKVDNRQTGENSGDELTGKWDPLKGGVLLLWEPADPATYGLSPGQKYLVANGHHRFAFGDRQGVSRYNSQVIREADGYSAADARRLGAEINISDGKGSVYDQAVWFRNTAAALGADEALAAGERIGARGRKAANIGFSAGDSAWNAFINERITPDQAEAIASAAPGNDNAQRVGLKYALDKRSPQDVANLIKAALVINGPKADQIDLFGVDDSALKLVELQAQAASVRQSQLEQDIRAVSGAAKNPEVARQYGVEVANPEAVKARVEQMKIERRRWQEWHKHPDLLKIVREEVEAQLKPPAEKPAEVAVKPPESGGVDSGAGTGDLVFAEGGAGGAGGAVAADPGRVAALPAGTPTVGSRMPMATNRVAPGSERMSVPEVMRQLEAVMRATGTRTPIRWGRMGELKRVARGFFRVKPEIIRLNSAKDIPTAIHEIAHAVAKMIFRKVGRPLATSTTGRVNSQLVALGRALYGSRKPAAGYTEEGFAEFLRMYLSRDDAHIAAPDVVTWFENVVLRAHPKMAVEIAKARQMLDLHREQGAVDTAKAAMAPPSKWTKKIKETFKKEFSRRGWFEEAEPLQTLVDAAKEVSGPVKITDDPFKILTSKRGQADGVLRTMFEDEMIDLWGAPTGGKPYRAALEGIPAGKATDFAAYLMARRVLRLAPHNIEGPITPEIAREVVTQLETPAFQRAAKATYDWWDGVLDYLAQSSPANAELVARIRASPKSEDYVPFSRELDERIARIINPNQRGAGGGLHRIRGSGLRVKDLYENTVNSAYGLIRKAHRDMIADAVIRLSDREGLGFLLEEVPKDKVREVVSLNKVRDQLEAAGIDTSAVPDLGLEYFTHADKPRGWDSVHVSKTGPGGEPRWFQVPPEIMQILEGVPITAQWPAALRLLLSGTSKLQRAMWTGLRPGFAATNAIRDVTTFPLQTHYGGNPGGVFMAYMRAIGQNFRSSLSKLGYGTEPEPARILRNIQTPLANSLAGDVRETRRMIKGMHKGPIARRLSTPIETFRDTIGWFENLARLAELNRGLKSMNWKPGQRLAPEQLLELSLATKQVTTDFTARGGGDLNRFLQEVVPFFRANLQGQRAFARSFKGERLAGKARTRGQVAAQVGGWGGALTLATIANWYRNKDDEDYQGLPWRDRYLRSQIKLSDGVQLQVPRTQEWANLFQVIPEALLDSWYRQDPEAAKAAAEHILATESPDVVPGFFRPIIEQWRNRQQFFDRPIVPGSQERLPPGEQVSPYSTKVARALGKAFPNVISPRRVDALTYGYLGGAGADLLNMSGLGRDKSLREKELSDLAVVGSLFRRGGTTSANNRFISDFYDVRGFIEQRSRSKTRPMTAREEMVLMSVREAYKEVQETMVRASTVAQAAPRRELYRRAATIAKSRVDLARKLGVYK